MRNIHSIIILLVICIVSMFAISSHDTSDKYKTADTPQWSWQSGKFDPLQLRRGFHIFNQTCSQCHELKHVTYGNIKEYLVYNSEQFAPFLKHKKKFIGFDLNGKRQYGPVDLIDHIPTKYINDEEAILKNHGILPPALDQFMQQQPDPANYVYRYLMGFTDKADPNVKLLKHQTYNSFIKNHQTMMPNSLHAHEVVHKDKFDNSLKQEIIDVTTFLQWAVNPNYNKQQHQGPKILIFISTFILMLFALRYMYWNDIKDEEEAKGE